MPNWCHNTITVKGDDVVLERFITAQIADTDTQEQVFTFHAQCPVPPEFLKRDESVLDVNGNQSLEAWRYEHWGTDRDVHPEDVSVEHGAGELTLRMQTAWAPPVGWLTAVSQLWPTLEMTLTCSVPEMSFTGGVTAVAGKVVGHWALEAV